MRTVSQDNGPLPGPDREVIQEAPPQGASILREEKRQRRRAKRQQRKPPRKPKPLRTAYHQRLIRITPTYVR